MTRSSREPRVPGAALLKIAQVLFNKHLLSAVVEPTISDLQREVANAGPSRLKRMRAHWRGYRAFWTLTLVAPFASRASSPALDPDGVAFPDAIARLAIGSIVLALLAVVGGAFGTWVAFVTATGALFAIVIHAWHARHPSAISIPAKPERRSPQINFSSTEVAGNIGGLIFTVGSVIIVALGLPWMIWFLFAGTLAGFFLAWGLFAWHTTHPNVGLPENLIVLR